MKKILILTIVSFVLAFVFFWQMLYANISYWALFFSVIFSLIFLVLGIAGIFISLSYVDDKEDYDDIHISLD